MQRVLIVSNLFPPHVVGGAELVAHRQARALAARGYDIAVFAGRFEHDERDIGVLQLETEEGFPVYRLAIPEPGDPSQNFHRPDEERRFLSVLVAHQPKIVHFHNLSGLGANLIPAAKSFGCKVVVTMHDHWGLCFKNTLLRNDGTVCENVEDCAACLPSISRGDAPDVPIRLRRDYVLWCLSHADQILCPSNYMKSVLDGTKTLRGPIEHLSNGIPRDYAKRGVKHAYGPVQFACFSYLGEHKGLPTLLEAAGALAQQASYRGRWHLTIAGQGHLAERLTQDIGAGRFGDAVTYAGKLSHEKALELHERAHVVVLASEWPENEPVTLLESIAFGTAQIATRIGGNPELVDDGRAGLLFTPGNSNELAATLRRFIDDPTLASRMGDDNATRRDTYDEAHVLDRLCQIYETLRTCEAGTSSLAADEIIVLCAGCPPSAAFSRRLQLMLGRFHLAEDKTRPVRLIWHSWAAPDAWQQARRLLLWGAVSDRELSLLTRARRARIPVLIPSSSALAGVAGKDEGVGLYETLLDALSQIAALQDVADRHQGAEAALRTGRILNALAPPESFHLPARAS